MASTEQLPSGKWRGITRVNGKKVFTKAVEKMADAMADAIALENDRNTGGFVANMPEGTVGRHIHIYREKLEAKKQWGMTKENHLRALTRDLGRLQAAKITQRVVIDYALALDSKVTARSKIKRMNGETVLARISYLKEVFRKATVLWGVHKAVHEEIGNAIEALRANDIVYTNQGRERETNTAEITRIKAASIASPSGIPLADMIHILEVLPLRTGELLKIRWEDFNEAEKTVWLRARKHRNARMKARNDQKIPLPTIKGRDTWKLLFDRPRNADGPFDYLGNSVAHAFIRACKQAGVEDLHMHDLRAHAITQMIMDDVKLTTIMRISGHKNYKVMLGRYARINPKAVADEIELLMNDKEKTELKLA